MNKEVYITFRKVVNDVSSTTYATFAIYKYPAKFIPQVIIYILKNYAERGMWIFDPFAGYGTVGVVSRLYGCNYELWDLNPMLEVIHDTAIMKPIKINLNDLIRDLKSSQERFIPDWSNLRYWFPDPFLKELSRLWGYVHNLSDRRLKQFLYIPLLKVTRYFSYSDEKIHKLYKSKYAVEKVRNLLNINWGKKLYSMLEAEILNLLKKIREYNELNPKDVESRVKGGIDTLESKLDRDVDILITSPPYLQAQEYIRSTKLELFWLGYKEEYIRSLVKKEIPYRKISKIDVYSETYYEYRKMIKENHLLNLYDQYFYSVLGALSNLSERINNYMFIFVGPAKIRNMPIRIDKIVVEHLSEYGWDHEKTLIDTILARAMFNVQINPASGIQDSRMQTEHLVILKRRK